MEENNLNMFETVWRWVNDRILIFVWTIPLRLGFCAPLNTPTNTFSAPRTAKTYGWKAETNQAQALTNNSIHMEFISES